MISLLLCYPIHAECYFVFSSFASFLSMCALCDEKERVFLDLYFFFLTLNNTYFFFNTIDCIKDDALVSFSMMLAVRF